MTKLLRAIVLPLPKPAVVPLIAFAALPLLLANPLPGPLTATTARAIAITAVLAAILARHGVPHGGIND